MSDGDRKAAEEERTRRMRHHVVPRSVCPACGASADRASGIDHDHKPEPGDATVCFYCGELLIFTAELTLRTATPADLEGAPSDVLDLLYGAQRSVRMARS